MYKSEEYKDIAREMEERDIERDKKFQKIDDMHNVKWAMPKEWENTGWIRKYPSTKPADALDTAIRALSTKEPRLSIMPLLPNQETMDNFEKIERSLMWAWKQIAKRGQFSPTRSIVTSSIKYDEICAQLIHIPSHNKAVKAIGRESNEKGDFQLIVHHPQNVHVQYSDYGFERVDLCKYQPLHKVVDFWGNAGKELRTMVDGTKKTAMTQMVKVHDIWDKDVRYVWAEGVDAGWEFDLMPPTEHGLGFIPWVCRVGGSNLEDNIEDQRRPLLNSVVTGNIWETTNLFRSLMLSITMARAAEPTIKSTTPTGDGVDIDATEALGQFKLRPGEDMQKLPPSEIGQSIQSMYSLLGGEMETSAGISLLQMNSMPSGMAFATYNALMQSAMGTINPHKKTAELAIADIFSLMADWLRYSGSSLIGYDDRQRNMENNAPTWGAQEIVTVDMLPEREDLNIEVKLTEYIPSDEMGKINAMVMMVKNMNYPLQRALEAVDVADPKVALEEWASEQMTQATVMEQVKDLQFDAEMFRQQKQLEMQQKQQEQQMQQQQMQEQQAQEQQAQEQPQGAPQDVQGDQNMISPDMGENYQNSPFEQTQGIGFAGNFGGSTPITAAPEMGVTLPQLEGVDYRGLRMPPDGRPAKK
jgi:hypothetical protein